MTFDDIGTPTSDEATVGEALSWPRRIENYRRINGRRWHALQMRPQCRFAQRSDGSAAIESVVWPA